jgi:hypothetical protein
MGIRIMANAICLDCGTAQENTENALCVNGHDNWLEATDEMERFQAAIKKFGCSMETIVSSIKNNVDLKVPINAQRDFFEKEDGVRSWYKCPSCGDENVRWKNLYCEACNCEFEWSGHKM